MKGRWVHIAVCAIILGVTGAGCMHHPYELVTEDYVVVSPKDTDTAESLAEKYLNDAEKGWVITDFNNIDEVSEGQRLIIPRHPFNRVGGMGQGGYQLVPVLCYGTFRLSEQETVPEARERFERQMAYLKKNRFQVISVPTLTEFFDANGQIHAKSLVITLDDNSRDVLDVALPVLEKYGYPAMVFVDPDQVDKEGNLTEEDLKKLSDKGLSIQSRAGWTADGEIESGEVGVEQYFRTMAKLIPSAKEYLENVSGKPCVYYAFPPSGANNLLIVLLEKEGYTSAFNRNGKSNPFYVDHYDINRIPVDPAWTMNEFSGKLSVFRKLELN